MTEFKMEGPLVVFFLRCRCVHYMPDPFSDYDPPEILPQLEPGGPFELWQNAKTQVIWFAGSVTMPDRRRYSPVHDGLDQVRRRGYTLIYEAVPGLRAVFDIKLMRVDDIG